MSDWFFNVTRDIFLNMGAPIWIHNVVMALTRSLLILGFILVNALFLIWLERKVSGRIQNRPGPTRTGPFGLLQTMADALKLMSKEDIVPERADRLTFLLAPVLIFAPAMAVFIIIPWSNSIVIQDLNIGLIYIAAVTSFGVLSFLMAGWSSNNKWSLLGAMRSAAQLISYEVPLVLAVAGVAIMAGSLRLGDIVLAQQKSMWFIVPQILGFLVFLVASLAELNRAPFDLVEAESELVAGYSTEYSGMRWGLFMLSEYGNLFASSAIATTLFLGGWSGPSFLPPLVWFLLKAYGLVFVAMWIRWTMPRIRVDQLMELGWKGLIPIALINLFWVGVLRLVM